MLNLHSPTSQRWLAQVRGRVDELLIDHAHCEKKAAGTALNLIFAYVRFAKQFADEATVHARLDELARAEAEILAQGDDVPRMHS